MRKWTMEELGRMSASEFQASDNKTKLVFVLDNVRSALNVGSAFRTADGFAFEKVILCGITAQPPHREILKTALGSTESVAWEYYEHTSDALAALRAEGYQVLGIEQVQGSVSLEAFEIDAAQQYALVLGNEVDGVSDAALAACDACIEIPQLGTKHSLNIAVCAGIVGWEFFKGLRFG